MKPARLLLSAAAVLSLLACSQFTVLQALQEYTNPASLETTAVVPLAQAPPAPPLENGFGQSARTYLEALTAIGARPSGSENERLAAYYIRGIFTDLGYQPETQDFTAHKENGESFPSANVIAVKPGDSSQEIIIGAHYDSGAQGLGADDNASGVAVMLETAERLVGMQTPYTIRFIAFGAEEAGLFGSTYYAGNMTPEQVQNTLAMVNLDSLGAGDITYVYSDEGEDAFLRDWVLGWAEQNSVPMQTILDANLTSDGNYLSDFGAFKERGIPYIYFEATNWTLGNLDGWTQVDPRYGDKGYIWHTPYDSLKYLDATFPGRVDAHLNIFVSALFAVTTEFHQ